MQRRWYLIAYDITDPQRLRKISRMARGFKVEGQKSFCECWLTTAECERLLAGLRARIDPTRDRVHAIALDPRRRPLLWGVARSPREPTFIIT